MGTPAVVDRALLSRRNWMRAAAAGLGGLAGARAAFAQGSAAGRGMPTRFQVACMTLPYARFPFKRALTGLQSAGYRHVAWSAAHDEGSGQRVPVLAPDAPVERAKDLGKVCRDLGLDPVMIFGPSPEALDALKHRVRQAEAAGIAQVLTMGTTRGNDAALWVKNFRTLGPFARDHGVVVVVKQHGGNTGTGAALAAITRGVADDGVKISYDAGNVMDYLNVDPIPDLKECAGEVRSFCIKDHRNTPKDQDCGPGFGEIDHYFLLAPLAFTGRVLPLCCENVFAPLLPPPAAPEGIDALARRAREYVETVIQGLQA